MERLQRHPRFGYLAGTGEEVESTVPQTIHEAQLKNTPFNLEAALSLYGNKVMETGGSRFGPTQIQRIGQSSQSPARVIHIGVDEMTSKQRKAANREERKRARQTG